MSEFSKLPKDLQSAVNRAVEKVKFTSQAADYVCGTRRVHAYPLRGGRICWGIIEGQKCIATDLAQ